jgi:phage terminase small subunit
MAERAFTDKQRRFIEEYPVDLNATAAAIRAGYTDGPGIRQTAHDLMADPDIVEAIAADMLERSKRVNVTKDYVLTNLMEIVERCMQRAPVMVKVGKSWEQATDDDGNHIWQFDAKGANTALTLLGKHLGLYIERRELILPKGTGVLAVPLAPTSAQWAAGAEQQQAALVARPDIVPEQGS